MNYIALPTFGEDGAVHIVVESPRGSTVKLKYDSGLNAFMLSRPLTEGVVYPHDWGFVPSTCASDGDPLDALVVWDRPSFPGVVLACRLIGVLAVEQNSRTRPGQRERNDRVIALPLAAPRYDSVTNVNDLPARTRQELEAFFVAAAALERKDLAFSGWADAAAAYDLVRGAMHPPSANGGRS